MVLENPFSLNPFHPEFMKWTSPSLNSNVPLLQVGISIRNQNRMANNVDPDETAHYEPSHQGLHCLHRYLVWFGL